MARDYYKVLGVDRGASEADIKRAYRRLARQYHPDVTGDEPSATEKFKEITAAYEVLSDAKRRRAYDLFGGPTGGDDGGAFGDFGASVQEVWNDVFGRKPNRDPEPGVDVDVDVDVTFTEAFTGTEKHVDVDLLRPCSECRGTGAPSDSVEVECAECRGTGQKGVAGPLPLKRTCPRCDGRGKVHPRPCPACRGTKTRLAQERLKVTIPAGVDTGSRLRLKQKGAAGRNGGPSGDLYVVVAVAPDPRFTRDGEMLQTELRVGLRTALLGGKVDVPLPNGSAKMTIPPGTQGGQVFRIRGRGFPRLASGVPGDALVTIQLRVPTGLNDDARRLVEELAEVLPEL